MNSKPMLLATTLVGALAVSNVSLAMNLVVNGDFEANGGLGQIDVDTFATGWTNTSGSFSGLANNYIADTSSDDPNVNFLVGPDSGVNNGFTGSSDGGYFLAAEADFNTGALFQDISGLTVGVEYLLSFEWAAAQSDLAMGFSSQGWQISFGSDTVSTDQVELPYRGFSPWTIFNQTFTATSTTQTLSLLAVGQAVGGYSLLDGISLQANSPSGPSVPEPATLALLALGLAGLSARRQWSRR